MGMTKCVIQDRTSCRDSNPWSHDVSSIFYICTQKHTNLCRWQHQGTNKHMQLR